MANEEEFINTTFLRLSMLQEWRDIGIWEKFLNVYPIRTIVEIGTWQGAFSIILLLQCVQRNIKFFTFDVRRAKGLDSPAAIRVGLRDHFLQGDIFVDERFKGILADESLHPMLVYCDGGDKPKEFKFVVPLLQQGDIVVAHDWDREFLPHNVEPVADMVEPIFVNECENIGSLTRFWERR